MEFSGILGGIRDERKKQIIRELWMQNNLDFIGIQESKRRLSMTIIPRLPGRRQSVSAGNGCLKLELLGVLNGDE